MSQTQSIIVYRNPLEQQFWEGALNSPGLTLYIMLMMILSVFVIWLLQGPVLNRINRKNVGNRRNRNKNSANIMWIVSFVIIGVAGYFLSFLLQ